MDHPKKEWFDDWFESPWYHKLYSHRTDEEASKAIDLFRSKTKLADGSRVLDLCCGTGRHAKSLAECGFDVTGIDNSHYFINKATLENTMDTLEFFHCDMRDEYPGKPYDAVVNFFTSFGYFEEDSDNLLVLQQVYNSLSPTGWFLLDYLNESKVRSQLVSKSVKNLYDAIITEERRIDGKFVIKNITIEQDNQETMHFQERVKLYDKFDFDRLFTQANLRIIDYVGSYIGEKFDIQSSSRLIIIAQRLV
ncbi:MAG: class I SAM-dependent methyltransferase [Ignavibacteria bacterium]|nr:class I SAM-dependent methyltransferase [Ignavibacteria bacterium]